MADKPVKGDVTGQYISNLNSPYLTTTNWNTANPFYANGAKDTNFGWFGPLDPLYPIAPKEVAGRQFDYQAGYNLNTVTRPYSAVPFWHLRALADGYDILRIIIETRKNEIARKLWAIKPREEDGNKEDPDIKRIEQFFRRPDGIHDFNSWIKMLVEDLFVIDAPTVYVHRNKGGQMINLFPIAGDTIKPVIDDWGRRPGPIMDAGKIVYPVAYQQILHGYPAIDYSMRDLIYRPMNVRTNHVYGYSIVEQIIGTIQVGLRRQGFLLDYYEDGTIPDCLIGTPDTWCYSDDTEVLTKRGWLRFGEVDHVNDEFATRNKEGKFEWQRAIGINRTIYKGKMVALKSRTIDCLVNPPHRVLVSTKGKFDTNYEKIKTAGELLEDHTRDERIPVVSLWENGVEIKTQIFTHNQTQGQCRDVVMTGDQFCMFMGAYLSEGHLNERNVFITQPENCNGYSQYYNLLKEILGKPAAYDKKQAFSFGSTPLVNYLRQFGKAVNKFIPEQIMNATKAQIELFLEYYLLGDGSFDKRTISTSSKKMADQLQELVQKIGKSATISEDDRRGRIINIAGRTAVTNSINYIVYISESQCRRFNVTEELDYNDFVSCVSVPNGILYVRRNGKPCWSGNTPDQISAYQRHWDSYFDSNLARKRKAKFVPGGVAKTFIQTKEPELKGELDEWIARVCCKAFAISPTGFVRDSNRATAQVASNDAEAQGLQPVLDYLIDFINYIIEIEFGRPDLTFAWQEDNEVSATEQQTILNGYVTTGQLTINESRAIRGLPPLSDPEANQALVMTANGYVPLNQQAAVQQKVNEQKALLPLQPKPVIAPQNNKPNVKKDFNPSEPRDEHGRWTSDGSTMSDKEIKRQQRKEEERKEKEKAKEKREQYRREKAEAEREALEARLKYRRERDAEREKIRAKKEQERLERAKNKDMDNPEYAHKKFIKVLAQTGVGTAAILSGAALTAFGPETASAAATAFVLQNIVGKALIAKALTTTIEFALHTLDLKSDEANEIKEQIVEAFRGIDNIGDFFFGKSFKQSQFENLFKELLPIALNFYSDNCIAYINKNSEEFSEENKQKLIDEINDSVDEALKTISDFHIKIDTTNKFAKGLPQDPFQERAVKAAHKSLKDQLTVALNKTSIIVGKQTHNALTKLGKATSTNENDATAAQIANDVDLSDLSDVNFEDPLSEVASTAVKRSFVQMGTNLPSQLVDKVNQKAIDEAKIRAGDLVSLDGDESVVASTRRAIKQVIVDGLENNIGKDAIAENLKNDFAFSEDRADLIATTEISIANGNANLTSYKAASELVPMKKAWLIAPQGCCDKCQSNSDAGPIDLDDDFPTGDSTTPAHPRCRCTVIPVIDQ